MLCALIWTVADMDGSEVIGYNGVPDTPCMCGVYVLTTGYRPRDLTTPWDAVFHPQEVLAGCI